MFKTCPRCSAEYLPHVSDCPSCHVALQHGSAAEFDAKDQRKFTRVVEAREPVALTEPVMLRGGDVAELREIAERLTDAGVMCAIDTDPPGARIAGSQRVLSQGNSGRDARLAIYVERTDHAAAVSVLEAWMTDTVPDAQHALATGALDRCPGCDEPLAPSAAGCASCGLEFPEMQATCPNCGQVVVPDAESCPSCGHQP